MKTKTRAFEKGVDLGKGRVIRVLAGLGTDLHDLAEAVLDVGGEGEGDIGGEIGDADALRYYLDRLFWDDAHLCLSLPLLSLGRRASTRRV